MGRVSPTPPPEPESPVKTRKLTVETLEARALMAVVGPPTPLGISLNSYGVLNIKGGTQDDAAHVWTTDGEVHATLSHTFHKVIDGHQSTVTVSDPEKIYPQ